MTIPVPSRDELLAAELPVEVLGESRQEQIGRTGAVIARRSYGTVTRRHRTKEEAMSFGSAERAVIATALGLKDWRAT